MQQAPSTLTGIEIDHGLLSSCGLPMLADFEVFDPADPGASRTATLDKIASCFATGALRDQTLIVVGAKTPRATGEASSLDLSRADEVANSMIAKGVERHRVIVMERDKSDLWDSNGQGWSYDRIVRIQVKP